MKKIVNFCVDEIEGQIQRTWTNCIVSSCLDIQQANSFENTVATHKLSNENNNFYLLMRSDAYMCQ